MLDCEARKTVFHQINQHRKKEKKVENKTSGGCVFLWTSGDRKCHQTRTLVFDQYIINRIFSIETKAKENVEQ